MSIAYAACAPSTAARAMHHHHWDRLRILAMLDVASWHLGGVHALAGIGLPLFHMLSVALSVRASPRKPFVIGRVRRLFVPWLFWSVLFATLRAFHNLHAARPVGDGFEPRMLLYGAEIHLWFLPFTLVSTSLAHALGARGEGRLPETALLTAALAAGLSLLPLSLMVSFGWPFDQWIFSIPACLLGFAVGRSQVEALPVRARALLTIALATLGVWLGTTSRLDSPTSLHLLRFLVAFSALVLATWLPDVPDRLTSFLRPLLLGTYIVHPVLYAELLDDPLWRVGFGRSIWARCALGLLASIAAVWLLRRTALRRFL